MTLSYFVLHNPGSICTSVLPHNAVFSDLLTKLDKRQRARLIANV